MGGLFLILVFFLPLLVAGTGAYFIARKFYRILEKEQSKWARVVGILIFIVSFAIILLILNWVFLSRINLGR